MPPLDLYQFLALLVLALLVFAILWIVRHKPYVRVRILWLILVELRETPPEEPKKPRKKKDEP